MAKQRPNKHGQKKKLDVAKRAEKSARFSIVAALVLVLAGVVAVTTYNSAQSRGNEISLRMDRMLFVGDVFLGRRVETYMEQHGVEYPFKRMQGVFKRHGDIVGNFESAIPEVHRHTPDLTYRFSTQKEFVEALKGAGFTGVSLANNHTLDFGDAGYEHTLEVFAASDIQASGHPSALSEDDIQYYTLDSLNVALIPLNLTYGERTLKNIDAVLEEAEAGSDYQIVFVHWGTEYRLRANTGQERIARNLVDKGVDAVIGHHPHVVQNIERYEDGIIFYSLGNFIFDQFNNIDRERGLALSFYFEDDMLHYDLIPVTSEDERSSPREMDEKERETFLSLLAARSDQSLRDEIEKGTIEQHIYDIQ